MSTVTRSETTFLSTVWSLMRTPVPPGYRGWLAFGWPLLFLFLLQVATGILLSFYYQSSPGEAAESTRRILRDVDGGWLVLGVHHWAGQAMVALCLLQLARALFMRAWRGEKSGSWYIGLCLLPLSVLLAYSGNLLKWDVGAHATVVAALDAVSEIPWIGPGLAYMVRGGEEIGGTTLSRLHSAHTQFLPWFVFVLVTFHLVLFARRHRMASRAAAGPGKEG